MTQLVATRTEESQFVARARSIYLSIYSISLCDSVTVFVGELVLSDFKQLWQGHRGTVALNQL